MHIDRLIESTLRNSKLKRVRIKVDPSQLVTHGYENVSSFEGYVLEENNASVKVYLMNVPKEFDPVQTVDAKHVTLAPEQPPVPNFNTFKQKVLSYLVNNNNVSKENPVYKQIENANNPEFIETYLKELKFDDTKLLHLYKHLLCNESVVGDALKNVSWGTVQKGAQSVLSNPLYKLGSLAAKTIAGTPGLLIGKNNIIGRIAKFIKTLDVNDLMATDKIKIHSTEFDSRPQKNETVLISFPSSLKLPNLPVEKYGDFEYQLKGVVEGSVLREHKAKVTKLRDLSPAWVDRELTLSLDFSILNNSEKTGTLIIDFKGGDTSARFYKVKILNYKSIWIVGVIEKLDSKMVAEVGGIGKSLAQDETLALVSKALEQYLNKRSVDNKMLDDIINSVATKILDGNRDRNLQKFDEVMIKLVEDPNASKTMDPLMYLRKYLKEAALL
ncbi:MAG: hypothetical protein EBU90_03250 [Proteobacteria bacterium]|nr:hypothetical protein [Pseudomonadota bacterium]NBP13343.1 hypothetical protein [bacterium]